MVEEPILSSEPDGGRKKASKLFTVCPFILGNEFCERLAFYGLATNLSIYLMTEMGLSVGGASIQSSLFAGTCYMTPLLGAWLADGYWGRFRTIMVFSIIYAIGMFWMATTALMPGLSPASSTAEIPPPATTAQLLIFYGALYTVAVGTGGIKPNVSAFGADQFDDRDRTERKQKQSFFNWFYFSINVGSLIASTFIVWVQGWSWGLGFAIPAVAMALAVVVFYAGHSRYTHREAKGSPLERFIFLSSAAFCEWLRGIVVPSRRQRVAPPPSGQEDATESSALFSSALADAQAPLVKVDALDRAGADRGYVGKQVEEVRMVLRMAPIFLLTIFYWTIYSQMASVYVIQAQSMDRDIYLWGRDRAPFVMPAASMAMFDTISIVVLIPIYDGIVHPLMKRCRCELTMLQRIGWGFLVVTGAMLWAAVIEQRRMAAVESGGNLSVLAQAPQYILVGASEVLASIGQIEFFYDQAPDVMRSCCTALSLLATSLGGYLSAAIMALVDAQTTWLRDLSHGSRLDLYFLLLSAAMLVNTVVFAAAAVQYKYKTVKHRAPLPLIGGQQGLAEWHTRPVPVTGVQPRPGAHAQAIDINVRPGYGYQYAGTPSTPGTPDVGPYGRSVTYAPATPVMPLR